MILGGIYKFICSCGECEERYKSSSDESDEICKICKKEMKRVEQNNTNTVLGKFANATPAQRKQILLKRSHEHFNREIKEQKHEDLKLMKKALIGK